MFMRVRAVFIWLLVLAIPAQGAAAATMAFCGPSHHSGAAQHGPAAGGPQDHGAHQVGDAPGRDSGTHSDPRFDHHSAAVNAPADEASAPTHLLQADNPKCSACASCCSAVALVGGIELPATPEFAATVFDTVVPSVGHFAADSLERPPRNLLA